MIALGNEFVNLISGLVMFPDLKVLSSSCVNAPENKILSNRGAVSSPEELEPPVERLVCIWNHK